MSTYRLDVAAFRVNLLNADWMVEEMRRRAEAGRAFAEGDAPRDTGAYSSKFRVEAGKNGGVHSDRAEGRLFNDDDAAMSIEFGHVTPKGTRVEGSHTLIRALDAMR